ncbi:hypothetical protein GCM10023147_44540 [Tsukamurella soli]|uniref:Uncharacterized protein n=1 Tax=Tsukamurella soli TaxID=644556 RepID=A0ABP8KAZ8_9ACTN
MLVVCTLGLPQEGADPGEQLVVVHAVTLVIPSDKNRGRRALNTSSIVRNRAGTRPVPRAVPRHVTGRPTLPPGA